MVVSHCGNSYFPSKYIFEKKIVKSTIFFYLSSSFVSGFFKVISILSLWRVTSVPFCRASITVYKMAKAKISPTPRKTDGSIFPVGGSKKLTVSSVTLMARHTQKAILLDFVKFLKNLDIFFDKNIGFSKISD